MRWILTIPPSFAERTVQGAEGDVPSAEKGGGVFVIPVFLRQRERERAVASSSLTAKLGAHVKLYLAAVCVWFISLP